MEKCLHFKENEIMDFLSFCINHKDIDFKWNLIKDKVRPYSVHMTFTKDSTNDDIYKKVDEIRGF